jgi:hypothetical protein
VATPPQVPRFEAKAFPGAPAWLGKLLDLLRAPFLAIHTALAGNLTLRENHACVVHTGLVVTTDADNPSFGAAGPAGPPGPPGEDGADGTLEEPNFVAASISAAFGTNNTADWIPVPGMSVTLTTSGRPVQVLSQQSVAPVGSTGWGRLTLFRDGVNLGDAVVGLHGTTSLSTASTTPASLSFVDSPSAGTHTYQLHIKAGAGTFYVSPGGQVAQLSALELGAGAQGPEGPVGGTSIVATGFNSYQPGVGLSTTTSSAVFADLLTTTFEQAEASQTIVVQVDATMWTNVASTRVALCIVYDGVAQPEVPFMFNTANAHATITKTFRFTGSPTPGTKTVALQWRRLTGTGVITVDNSDVVSMLVQSTVVVSGGGGSGGVTDHGALTGLADDDHPQYALADGTRGAFATSGHTHTFASLTSKPTTLAGYGITDAATSTHNHDATYAAVSHAHTNTYAPARPLIQVGEAYGFTMVDANEMTPALTSVQALPTTIGSIYNGTTKEWVLPSLGTYRITVQWRPDMSAPAVPVTFKINVVLLTGGSVVSNWPAFQTARPGDETTFSASWIAGGGSGQSFQLRLQHDYSGSLSGGYILFTIEYLCP